jgi:phage tail sheath protein FI
MPEYLAPGVYVEEVSYRAKSIEGVSTTTTGLIGPARYGPVNMEPDIITSLGEFERVYGDRERLEFDSGDPTSPFVMDNYLWHAARAFFTEGGKRLYISRIFNPTSGQYPPDGGFDSVALNQTTKLYPDGHARAFIPGPEPDKGQLKIRARFPGAAGRMRVRLTLRLGQNILTSEPVRDAQGNIDYNAPAKPRVNSLVDRDIVWIRNLASPVAPISPLDAGAGDYYIATSVYDKTAKEMTWRFDAIDADSPSAPVISAIGSPYEGTTLWLRDLNPDIHGDKIRVVTLSITTVAENGTTQVWNDLALDPDHERAGSPDSVFARFAEDPGSLSQALRLPIIITGGKAVAGNSASLSYVVDSGLDVVKALFSANAQLRGALDNMLSTDEQRSLVVELTGGNDGKRPTAAEYEGNDDPSQSTKTGLKQFEDLEDISIVAAPGSTFIAEGDGNYRVQAMTIVSHLIRHAERMRYRIAVLDSMNGLAISDVRSMRAKFDSTYAAFYYPWVRILDPVTQRETYMPPSGFVAGIYARNDVNRAVYKAPANEVVGLAIGFEQLLNKSQQDVLNPEGINCFRFFEGRGFRLWGARTISSDPEWKYVNLRRYFAYLERSIDKGTQWAVFEANGEALWANVRRTIEDFLFNEWQMGALLGDKPEKAFFVRCDRSTMTQNDLDNGRLVCLIGVAPLRPAEFVIFRIGQWTADRKS